MGWPRESQGGSRDSNADQFANTTWQAIHGEYERGKADAARWRKSVAAGMNLGLQNRRLVDILAELGSFAAGSLG